MTCTVEYIEKQKFSRTEKDRLTGIYVDVFDTAKATKVFREVNNRLVAGKHKYADALAAVAKINQKYGQVAKLSKIVSTANTEQFALNVNVLPLTTEKQYDIVFEAPPSLTKESRSAELRKYIPFDSAEIKPALERLITEESGVVEKESLIKLLQNVDKVNTTLHVSLLEDSAGRFTIENREVGKTRIDLDPRIKPQHVRYLLHHELIHAYSVGVLQNPQTEQEKEFNRNVERVVSLLQTKYGDDYSVSDKYEFIAELASNKEFRDKIKGDDLWNRILRLFRNLLGMKDSFDKILDEFYNILDQSSNLQSYISETEHALKDKPIKKSLDALEKMIHILNQRIKRLEYKGLSKEKQAVEETKKKLEEYSIGKRNLAVLESLTFIQKDLASLTDDYQNMAKDPANINPDKLRNIGEQLSSYDIVESFSNQIEKNASQFVLDEADAPELKKLLRDLRVRINLFKEDIKDLNIKRGAQFIKNELGDQKITEEQIEDQLKVADRDISWWSRLFESPRNWFDKAATAVFKALERTTAQAYQDNLEQDLYRTEAKVENLNYKTWKPAIGGGDWFNNHRQFTSVGILKAETEYENWLKATGRSMSNPVDKYKPILDMETFKEGSTGVEFVSPLSKEGKVILAITEKSPDFPLRQYYETVVLGYLKAQERIPNPSMRPGLRIPSISRSLFEGVVREEGLKKFNLFSEKLRQSLRKRYDDTDYRAVDANLNPINYLPIRFISLQDGTEGRMSTREVSLDLGSTIPMFMEETRSRQGMLAIQSDLEIVKEQLGEREVVKSNKRIKGPGITGWLSSEREANYSDDPSVYQTIKGTESESFKAVETLLRRFMYGEFKKDGGEIELFGKKVTVRKATETLLKYTGMNIMLGNLAIPATNLFVGEITLFKEALGGNIISKENLWAGTKLTKDAALGSLSDLSNREKKSKFGRIFTYFNVMGNERPEDNIGIDSTWMRRVQSKLFGGHGMVEYQQASTVLGAVLDKFKAKDKEGKDVSLYQAIEVNMNGKLSVLPGYTYNGKTTIDQTTINKIRNQAVRIYELVNGNYTRMASPGATEYIGGDLVMFMRKWLPEGIAARWKTKYYDESLGQENEGYYVSALVAFNNVFTSKRGWVPNMTDTLRILTWFGAKDEKLLLLPNELELSPEEQEQIINLRKAGIKKAMFDLYAITALTLGLIMLGSGDEDDDSYALYMMARVRRELMTFISPTTAWDVLRSPTIALNTIGGFNRIIGATIDATGAILTGEDLAVMKRGTGKGQNELLFRILQQSGGAGFLYQFDNLTQKTQLIQSGGWR